jgi:hypothetical protein
MKIAIPVSAHDKHLLPAQADCLLKMGGLEEHQVIYFPTLAAKDAAYEAAERLGAQVHPLNRDFEGGPPVACNNHFAAVVDAFGLTGNSEPFLLMEPDMLPVSPRWADKLLDDYRMRGTPFMGNVVLTPFEDNGKLMFKGGDTMMMGCGIYPAHMERDERIKPLIADLAKPAWMNPRIPWDIYLRWAIKNIGVSDTPLIADMWATENYHLEGGELLCQSVDHGERVVRKRGGMVPAQALLIHGCKDGSLAKIVLGMMRHPTQSAGKIAALKKATTFFDPAFDTPGPEGADGIPSPAGIYDKGVGEAPGIPSPAGVADDGFWGSEDKQPSQAPEPETVVPVVAPKPPVHTVTKVKESKTITRADIEKALNGKKMRINDLAAKLKVGVPDLVGTFATNGYIVATAGWVQSTINITKD